MIEYIGLSPDMLGYDRVYWASFIYGRIPPDMLD
jgi:hypothetical protein